MKLARAALLSGWLPAAAVYLAAVLIMDATSLIGVRVVVWYTVCFLWLHTVPGTVLWRLLDWRRPAGHGRARPFLEDVVLGSMTGLIIAIPVYLALVVVGAQRLVLLWPLLVLAPALATSRGRGVFRGRSAPMPAWWSWALALIVLYVVIYSANRFWLPYAFTSATMLSPHVDEPFHLAMIGEFRHHFPAEVPYVDGTPLRYHWLVYPLMALESWGSGISPVMVVRLLAPAAFSMMALLGVTVAAVRLSGHRWAGLAAAAIVCVLTPLDLMGWSATTRPWLPSRWMAYLSPTQFLATALSPLLIVMVVGIARGSARRPRDWMFTALVMLACAGAKSAMLPLFVGGLCGTAVVMLVLRRRAALRTAGLAVLSIAVFAAATYVFYGVGSRAMKVAPLALIDSMTQRLEIVPPDVPAGGAMRSLVAVVFVVCTLAPVAGGVGLFLDRGWRRPTPWILLGTGLTAVAAVLLLDHPALSQLYFLFSASVPLGVFGAMGLARLAGPLDRRTALTAVAAGIVGLGVAFAISAVTSTRLPTGPDDIAGVTIAFVLPLVAGALAVGLILLALTVASRRWPWLRARRLLLSLVVVGGMCAPSAAAVAVKGINERPPPPPPTGIIGPGGIKAATWLERHSKPDELVATNTHKWRAAWRNFWVSGYSERRVLVEGWAYVAPEAVGIPSNEANNANGGPPVFWDLPRLRLNDEVFSHPTAANVRELQRRYGVDWLFADRAERPDVGGLSRVAELEYRTRRYLVYRLPTESR